MSGGLKISELLAGNPAGALSDSDGFEVTQAGASRGVRASQLRDYIGSTLTVQSFGAVGDGVTDDAAALQAAVDSGTPELYFPAGTYRITSSLTHPGNQHWHGAGIDRTVIERSGIGGCTAALGSINTSQGNTFVSAAAGTSSVALAAGKGTNFAAGDIAYIIDETTITGTLQKQGEFVTVKSVAVDTVNFLSPIQYSYSSSAQLQKITMLDGVQVSGMSFTNAVATDATSNLAAFSWCNTPRIINCSAYNGIRAGFGFLGCVGARAVVEVHDLLSSTTLSHLGYGVAEIGGNLGGQFDITATRVRHAYSTVNSGTLVYGVATSSIVRGVATDTFMSGWDTHEEAYGITFDAVSVNGSGHSGIQLRGKCCQAIGCNITKTIGPGIYVTATAQDTMLDGCLMDRTNCGTNIEDGIDWTVLGGVEDRGTRTFVNGGFIRNAGGSGINVHASALAPVYRSVRIVDPCRISTTIKDGISAIATTATTVRIDSVDISCSDTRMDYGIRTLSSAQDPLITGVLVAGAQSVPIETNAAHKSWGHAVNGPVSFGPQSTATIAGGILNITTLQTGLIAISGEGGLADDLDTINSGADNQTIMIRRGTGNITLKHGTGNILTATGADVLISSSTKMLMLTRSAGSNWVMTAAS